MKLSVTTSTSLPMHDPGFKDIESKIHQQFRLVFYAPIADIERGVAWIARGEKTPISIQVQGSVYGGVGAAPRPY